MNVIGLKGFRLFAVLLFSLMACSKSENVEKRVVIATAANVQFAMEELVKEFQEKSDVKCDLVVSSSGKLTAQVKAGAPYDIFVSANMKYPEALFEEGFTQGKPQVYALGGLVLWSVSSKTPLSLPLLLDEKIKHIAVANPKTAPYGDGAVELLKSLQLYDKLKHKLVFGESISQVNQFVLSQSAFAGFTAHSVVLSDKLKGKGIWQLMDKGKYKPIKQGAVLLKSENLYAKQFFDFLFSKQAKVILKKYGYE